MTVLGPPPEATRDRILDAADRVVVRDGARALTVASVAAEAGLSKGGVLHHFPSKEAMAAAMLERSVAAWDEALAATAAADPDPRGRTARAYIRVSLDEGNPDKRRLDRLSSAITATLLSFPEKLGPLQAQSDRFQDALAQDGIDPVDATLVRVAVDGLWLMETLGLVRFDPALKAAVARRLTEMTTTQQGRTT
jgi:AcrR family transcriptional regulator